MKKERKKDHPQTGKLNPDDIDLFEVIKNHSTLA